MPYARTQPAPFYPASDTDRSAAGEDDDFQDPDDSHDMEDESDVQGVPQKGKSSRSNDGPPSPHTMTVFVGKQLSPITIDPTSLLLRNSGFFRTALGIDINTRGLFEDGKYELSDDMIVYLPEISMPNFQLYVRNQSSKLKAVDYSKIQPHLAGKTSRSTPMSPYFVSHDSNYHHGPVTMEEFDHLNEQAIELFRCLVSLWIDAGFLGDRNLQGDIRCELRMIFTDSDRHRVSAPTPNRIPREIIRLVEEYTKGLETFDDAIGCELVEFCIEYLAVRRVSTIDLQSDGSTPWWLTLGLKELEKRRRDCELKHDPLPDFFLSRNFGKPRATVVHNWEKDLMRRARLEGDDAYTRMSKRAKKVEEADEDEREKVERGKAEKERVDKVERERVERIEKEGAKQVERGIMERNKWKRVQKNRRKRGIWK